MGELVLSLFAIVLLIGGVAIIKIFRNASSFEEWSESLSLEAAKYELDRNYRAVVRHLIDKKRSGISTREASKLMDQAVWATDRIHRLTGLEHGPKFRLRHRFELLESTRVVAEHSKYEEWVERTLSSS